MAILPISYVAIKLGASPEIAYIMIICVYPFALFMDLYIINKYTGFPAMNFLISIAMQSVLYIVVTALVVGLFVQGVLNAGFLRLMVTSIVSSLIFLPILYFVGMTKGERLFITNIIAKKLKLKKTL